jgi:hypothetical protein
MVILQLGIVCTVMLFLVGCGQTISLPQNARDAYNRGDYSTALKECQPLAEQGDANAQYNLGKLYYHGWGVAQDYAQARDWWRKAAAQGHLDAQNKLAGLTQSWLDKLSEQDKVQPVIGTDMSLHETLAYINEIFKVNNNSYISIQGLGKIVVRYSDNTLNGEAYGADIERVGQRDEWVYLICKKEVGNCWKTIFGSMKVIWFQMGDHSRNQERLVKTLTHLITKIVEESAPPHEPFDDSPLVPKSQRPIPLAPPQIPSSDKSTLDSLI